MEQNGQDRVAAFDAFFTNNRIQKLKVLMPFLDRSLQKSLAIYIKYLELRHTVAYFQRPRVSSQPDNPASPPAQTDLEQLCDALFPYCTEPEKARLQNLRSLFQRLTQFQEMMEMAEMMKELFPEGMDGSAPGQDASNTEGAGFAFSPELLQMLMQSFPNGDPPQQ